MNYKFTREEYEKVDQYLLYELGVQGVLRESTCRRIHSLAKILNEQVDIPEDVTDIFESTGPGFIRVDFDGTNFNISFGFGEFKKGEKGGTTNNVSPEKVKEAWYDARNHNAYQVLLDLGVSRDVLEWHVQYKKTSNLNNVLTRIYELHNTRFVPANPEVAELTSPGYHARKNVILNSHDRVEAMEEPDPESVNRRGSRSRYINKINQQEIVEGEFYRDVTRISKSKTRGWFRKWRNDLKRVSSQRKSLLGRFIGKTWKKSFLLGYQANRTIFYEVWYNSMDSSFSVYDRNGIETTHPVPTLQEAIRLLIRTVAQEAPGDSDVFSSSSAGQQMANSLRRSLELSTAKELSRVAREDERRNHELARENKERKNQHKDQKPQRRRDAAERKSRRGRSDDAWGQSSPTPMGQMDRVKTSIRNAAVAGAIALGDPSPSKLKSNKVTSKSPQTKASVDSMQKEMEDMQIEEYRQSLSYIHGRLSEQASKMESLTEDPDQIQSIGLDPELERLFRGQTSYSDVTHIAGIVAAELYAQMEDLEKITKKREGTDFSRELEAMLAKTGESAGTDPRVHFGEVGKRAMDRLSKFKGMFDNFIQESEEGDSLSGLKNYNRQLDAAKHEVDERTKQQRDAVKAQNEELGFDIHGAAGDRRAKEVAKQAKNSPYNRQLLLKDINDSISTYDVTKIRQSNMKSTVARWLGHLGRGRASPLQSPIESTSFFNRVKQSMFGETYRADFVLGYSLNDVINLEIWFITEIDPGSPDRRPISSFYVYDVSAQKIIRSHLPYLRNATMVISAKLGVQ